jgi:hypothetical protein
MFDMNTKISAILGGIAAALTAIATIFFAGRRAGTQAAAVRQAEEAHGQAVERSHADTDAARTDDPVARLRRDWSR